METTPVDWKSIQSIHFKFQKHCNPVYPEVHELLNWTYSQLVQDKDLDDLFLDGPGRTTFRSDVLVVLKEKIIELSTFCASATTDKSLVEQYMLEMPMRTKLCHGISLLRNSSSMETAFRTARNKSSDTIVIYLDIDALYFRPYNPDDGQFFNPKRFEDMSTTPLRFQDLNTDCGILPLPPETPDSAFERLPTRRGILSTSTNSNNTTTTRHHGKKTRWKDLYPRNRPRTTPTKSSSVTTTATAAYYETLDNESMNNPSDS